MNPNLSPLEPSDLIPRLISEFGYSFDGAKLVAQKLCICPPKIKDAFQKWWTDGSISPVAVAEVTVHQLMTEHGMKPIAAFLTLDWLIREPDKAKASLLRGHDRIR